MSLVQSIEIPHLSELSGNKTSNCYQVQQNALLLEGMFNDLVNLVQLVQPQWGNGH